MTIKYIDTTVEVYLDEWDDKELLEEIKNRGYTFNKLEEENITSQEIDRVVELIGDLKIGSCDYFIVDKLKRLSYENYNK